MDQEKLESFAAVALHMSFTKAAADRHLAQSTVSKHISALESELGVKLFQRDNNTIQLTPAGMQLKADAPSYINQFRFISSSLEKLTMEFQNKITIGVGNYEFALFTPVLDRFVQMYPRIEVAYMYYSYGRLMSHCRTNAIDLGVGNHLCAAALSNMESRTLFTARWVAAAREDSPFWAMPPEDQAVLRDQLVITTYNNEYEAVRPFCASRQLHPKAFTYTNTFFTLRAMLEIGACIALVPEGITHLLPPSVRWKDVLETPMELPVKVFFNPLNHNPSLARLVECCKEMYPDMDE